MVTLTPEVETNIDMVFVKLSFLVITFHSAKVHMKQRYTRTKWIHWILCWLISQHMICWSTTWLMKQN